MNLGRYEESTIPTGTLLPAEWTEAFIKVLTDTYYDQSEKDNRFFTVFGQLYDKEFVVVVSYIHHDDNFASPITLFLSHDIIDSSAKMKKALSDLVDLTSLIYDDVFAVSDWVDYLPSWMENKFKGNDFHYKITRENITLTLQAEELLKSDNPFDLKSE